MTDEPGLEHRERKRGGCFVVAFVVIPMAYILSPVFVSLLLQALPEPVASAIEPVLWIVYAPIRWLGESIPLVMEFYEWQFELVEL